MKPYYQEAGITIYHGDCRDVLPSLEPSPLIVTSPPYDKLRTYGGHVFKFESCALVVKSAVRLGGVLVWVVGDQSTDGDESGSSFEQALFYKSLGLKLWDTMVYEKNGPSYPSKHRYYQIFEYMFVFSNGIPSTVNLLKDRKNRWYGQKWSKDRTRRTKCGELTRQDWYVDGGEEYGVRFNIWRYNTGAGYSSNEDIAFEHPAIFPYRLAVDHILSWSNTGDVVLDPFGGSGTTMRAAKDLGRQGVMCEIEERYCEIAATRLQQDVLQFA